MVLGEIVNNSEYLWWKVGTVEKEFGIFLLQPEFGE